MSIRSKLTIMFLAIALIPLLLVSTITFTNYKNSLEASRFSQLRDLVTFKTEGVEAYLDGLMADLEIVQHSYLVKKNLPVLTRLANNPVDPEFLTAKKMLDDDLRKTPPVLGLSDIMLVNPKGIVVYSSNPEHYPKDFLTMLPDFQQKAFEEGKNKIYFSDVFLNKSEDNRPGMLVTAPAFNFNGGFIGVIALEVDMAYIYRLIQDVTGLGDTGETLLGQKIGNQAVFLNPLRHDPEAALKRKINIGEKVGGPIQEAVQGREGVGQLVDYRGKKVIAAWRYIPSLDWGIVAKIDTQEAFADVVNLRNLLIILLLIIFVLAGIMAFSIAQSISEPIKKLSKGAEIIGSGNLDYKIGINLKDEIGQLSRSFAKMTQDLKQTAASRDAERQRLYDVLETLPVYVVLLSENYHVPFANKFFCERFGESGGKRCYEYLFKLSEPCENCETYKVMKTNAPHHWEWTGPDGRNYDIYDFPFIDTDGSRMILEMGIDITEQKRVQNAVKQANAYHRNLIEVSLDPLVTISSEGKITDVNDATIRATGLSRQELIGTDFSNYFTEPEKARDGYRLVFSQGTVKDYSLTIRHKDGKLTDVLYNASVYKDQEGNVLGVFAAARDVTLQKQAEEELRRHRDNLEALVKERTSEVESVNSELLRSNENLEQFAYVASHDLQEPLRMMASFSELLERRYNDKLDTDATEFLGYIVDGAKRMQRLIHDLLAYSRVGRIDMPIGEIDCNSILGRVINSMMPAIEESKAVITHDELPTLVGNETNFIQLFQNLIGNAIKFYGPELPRVHVSTVKEGGEWVFSVRDNGIGIEPQYTDRIFLIFQRLHGRDKYPGTGIGLSICKKIVETQGGRIWVESEHGKGSTFYFTIPAKGELKNE